MQCVQLEILLPAQNLETGWACRHGSLVSTGVDELPQSTVPVRRDVVFCNWIRCKSTVFVSENRVRLDVLSSHYQRLLALFLHYKHVKTIRVVRFPGCRLYRLFHVPHYLTVCLLMGICMQFITPSDKSFIFPISGYDDGAGFFGIVGLMALASCQKY